MKVETFVKLFSTKKKYEDKVAAINEIMKNSSIKYSDKVKRAGIIAQNSYHTKKIDINGDEYEAFEQNSAAKYMLYTLTLVELYTTLEIDYKNSIDLFEKINGEILDMIIAAIDEREKKEFHMLLDFACDDLIVNEYETHSFIKSQVERFGTIIRTALLPALENLDIDKIMTAFNQISN